MLKILAFLLLILALGFGFSWLADRPGELSLLWQGLQIKMSLIVAASMMLAGVFAVMLVWWLIRLVWTSPHRVTRYFRARKRDRGYQALSTGLIAAGAGNAALASRMSERARSLISADQEPLIHLLDAQTALIRGDHEAARKTFEAMAEDPETRELGLRGLFLEARRLGADEAARQFAEQAAEKAPYLPWAAEAALEYRTRAGDYDSALLLIDQQKAAKVLSREEADRHKAVLLTARAEAKLEGDPKSARDDAQAALKLNPGLVPAALAGAKAAMRENNVRKASALLEQAWKLAPHPDIAALYSRLRQGDSAVDRLKRAEKLEAMRPGSVEGLMAVATQALAARDFARARDKAEQALKIDPRESVFLLLADIEEAETGSEARIRHWMQLALKAPRDPAWVADGQVSDVWRPVSPETGRIGGFEWKIPVSRLGGPELTEADLALPLPPLAVAAPVILAEPAAPPVAPAEPVIEAKAEQPKPAIEPAKPARSESPVRASQIAVSDKAASSPQKPAEPFFGGRPDDPGVKPKARSAEGEAPKSRLRLF